GRAAEPGSRKGLTMADILSEQQKVWGQVVAKAWADAAFKARLLADPKAALKEQGIVVPEGVQIQVHENTATTFNAILPTEPSDQLSDEQVESVAGGGLGGIFNPFGPGGWGPEFQTQKRT